MIAEEMGNSANRGKVIWVLASSRPDLIEVDLKRPGRVDVKIPLFPTTSARESFDLLRTLCHVRGMELAPDQFDGLSSSMPLLLTPGAAEALAVKIYRTVRTGGRTVIEVVRDSLSNYRHPVAPEVLEFQTRLAIEEATDTAFIPEFFSSGSYSVRSAGSSGGSF